MGREYSTNIPCLLGIRIRFTAVALTRQLSYPLASPTSSHPLGLRIDVAPLSRQESDPWLAILAIKTPVTVRPAVPLRVHALVTEGSVAAVESALKESTIDRATINVGNDAGYTPLMIAAALNDEESSVAMCKLLLSYNADVNARDKDGITALGWAAACTSTPTVCARTQLLINAGADVNASSETGETPLHRACRAGRAAVISCLMAAGADPRKQTLLGYNTPMDVAGYGNTVPASFDPEARALAVAALTARDGTLRARVLHHADCLAHVTREGHQEAPQRVIEILRRIRSSGLFPPEELLISDDVPLANEQQVTRAHSAAYYKLVLALSRHVAKHQTAVPFTPQIQRGLKKRNAETSSHSDTTFSVGSLNAALRAAGAVCRGIDLVASQAARHVLACVRPPGHHAGIDGLITDPESHPSCGFCIFNSVAIGALHALATHQQLRRIAIVDIVSYTTSSVRLPI